MLDGSGSGKSASYVIPNAYQLLGSYVFTDPKGELYDKTAGYLKSKGYDIRVLNLVNPKKSDGYNPLIIKGKKFFVNDDNKQKLLSDFDSNVVNSISDILDAKFTVGELCSTLIRKADLDTNTANDIMNCIIYSFTN